MYNNLHFVYDTFKKSKKNYLIIYKIFKRSKNLITQIIIQSIK
jgi:hypothetical protein